MPTVGDTFNIVEQTVTVMSATRGILSTMAVICLVALTAMAEDPRKLEKQVAVPTAGLTITRALAGKVDVTKLLAARVKNNRLVIVATSAFLGVDAGDDKLVVEYVLDGTPQTIGLSPIPGDELGVATPGADWVKGVAVLEHFKLNCSRSGQTSSWRRRE